MNIVFIRDFDPHCKYFLNIHRNTSKHTDVLQQYPTNRSLTMPKLRKILREDYSLHRERENTVIQSTETRIIFFEKDQWHAEPRKKHV